jgi:hypothetical protein
MDPSHFPIFGCIILQPQMAENSTFLSNKANKVVDVAARTAGRNRRSRLLAATPDKAEEQA